MNRLPASTGKGRLGSERPAPPHSASRLSGRAQPDPRLSYWINLWNETREGTSDLIPPQWFVDRWNERGQLGAPYATALDPIVMHAWHWTRRPFNLRWRL